MKRILGALYLLISLVLLGYGGFLIIERNRPIEASAPGSIQQYGNSLFTLHIPSADIRLPTYSATIRGTTWDTTKRGVSYLSTSPLPGERGNSVLYGHNWPNLLRNLRDVKPGDAVFVIRGTKTDRFIVRFVAVVKPSDYSVYAKTNDTRLTIYTCTGFLDRERLVVTAFPDIL